VSLRRNATVIPRGKEPRAHALAGLAEIRRRRRRHRVVFLDFRAPPTCRTVVVVDNEPVIPS
jgi:hypothetical protein